MAGNRRQASAAVAIIVSSMIALAVGAAPIDGGRAERLRSACAEAAKKDAKAVSPADAFALLKAGQVLEEQSFVRAATTAAKAVASAQSADGSFGDRAATRHGLALLLSVIESQKDAPDKALVDSADAAARWLRKRAHGNIGSWTRDDQLDGQKVIRLDDADYRDSTILLQLHHEVCDDPDSRAAVEMAYNALLNCQLSDGNRFLPGAMLWPTRCTPFGEEIATGNVAKSVADMVASRHAAQTVLGLYALTGNRGAYANELVRTAERFKVLRRDDGTWSRYTDTSPTATPDPAWPSGDFGLPSIIATATKVKDVSEARFVEILSERLSPRDRAAAMCLGLMDDAFELEPKTAADQSLWAAYWSATAP